MTNYNIPLHIRTRQEHIKKSIDALNERVGAKVFKSLQR